MNNGWSRSKLSLSHFLSFPLSLTVIKTDYIERLTAFAAVSVFTSKELFYQATNGYNDWYCYCSKWCDHFHTFSASILVNIHLSQNVLWNRTINYCLTTPPNKLLLASFFMREWLLLAVVDCCGKGQRKQTDNNQRGGGGKRGECVLLHSSHTFNHAY